MEHDTAKPMAAVHAKSHSTNPGMGGVVCSFQRHASRVFGRRILCQKSFHAVRRLLIFSDQPNQMITVLRSTLQPDQQVILGGMEPGTLCCRTPDLPPQVEAHPWQPEFPFKCPFKMDRAVVLFQLSKLKHFQRLLLLQHVAANLRFGGELDLIDWVDWENAPFPFRHLGCFKHHPTLMDYSQRMWREVLPEYQFECYEYQRFAMGFFALNRCRFTGVA